MPYGDAFRANTRLIEVLGESKAHLVWALGLYLEEPDLEALASESLTDGPDAKRIVLAQGYYGQAAKKDAAPSNKAADLNVACAWLLSARVDQVPAQLQATFIDCRTAIDQGDVESIDLIYVHNLPESVNVNKELQTVASHFRKALGEKRPITITPRELGSATIEHLFATQESHIVVTEAIECPAKVAFTESGPTWRAHVLSVPGIWLHNLFQKHGDSLFSANYRGFLGISKRRRINTAIRQSAEQKPKDFWAYNNGITLLTLGVAPTKDGTRLTGVSIINGAQTTGSIGSVDPNRNDLRDVQVLCRVIECTDTHTISDIVRYNNTQNEITTWDQYSNDPEQGRIAEEFAELGHAYARKRGFRPRGGQIGIEEVAQPLLAFHGKFRDAYRGKNEIFERKPLYNNAFEGKKARHILLVYALARAIDERRIELKTKSSEGNIITLEDKQLQLLRNLRFKQFFIAVISKTLEAVLGKRIDPETVAFSPSAASADNNSLVALVAAWSPVVEAFLTYVAAQLSPTDFGDKLAKDDIVDDVGEQVSALLYAGRGALRLDDFIAMTSDS